MHFAIRPVQTGEKPTEPGWYVVHVPRTGQNEIVRVHERRTSTSEPILSVTFTGSGDHYPMTTVAVTFIAQIDPEQIQRS